MSIAFEEVDESLFWLETIREKNLIAEDKLGSILKEGAELAAILAFASETSQAKLKQNIKS